jgi:hypothetical protein
VLDDVPGLRFHALEVETKKGLRRVLVATPTEEIRLGRERLAQMQAGELDSALDDALVAVVAGADRPFHGVVFRSEGEEPGASWSFHEELSEEEGTQMARLFVRSHVAVFRRLAEHAVALLVGVDFGVVEVAAYRRGTDALAAELEQALVGPDASAAEQARLDLWLAERQAYWSATPYTEYVAEQLADALVAAERQLARFRRLAEQRT